MEVMTDIILQVAYCEAIFMRLGLRQKLQMQLLYDRPSPSWTTWSPAVINSPNLLIPSLGFCSSWIHDMIITMSRYQVWITELARDIRLGFYLRADETWIIIGKYFHQSFVMDNSFLHVGEFNQSLSYTGRITDSDGPV